MEFGGVWSRVVKCTIARDRHGCERWWLDLECGHSDLTRNAIREGCQAYCEICTDKKKKEAKANG